MCALLNSSGGCVVEEQTAVFIRDGMPDIAIQSSSSSSSVAVVVVVVVVVVVYMRSVMAEPLMFVVDFCLSVAGGWIRWQ